MMSFVNAADAEFYKVVKFVHFYLVVALRAIAYLVKNFWLLFQVATNIIVS